MQHNKNNNNSNGGDYHASPYNFEISNNIDNCKNIINIGNDNNSDSKSNKNSNSNNNNNFRIIKTIKRNIKKKLTL